HDRLALRDGRWHFVERWALPDIIGDMSRHMKNPLPPGPLRAK
ncbi:MAG: nuclear transport factor 2 family protein, partial [bacterium]|nr:nuclear transport factor 2 family protein [bacterium]